MVCGSRYALRPSATIRATRSFSTAASGTTHARYHGVTYGEHATSKPAASANRARPRHASRASQRYATANSDAEIPSATGSGTAIWVSRFASDALVVSVTFSASGPNAPSHASPYASVAAATTATAVSANAACPRRSPRARASSVPSGSSRSGTHLTNVPIASATPARLRRPTAPSASAATISAPSHASLCAPPAACSASSGFHPTNAVANGPPLAATSTQATMAAAARARNAQDATSGEADSATGSAASVKAGP